MTEGEAPALARTLIDAGEGLRVEPIVGTLVRFGAPALRFAGERKTRVVPLRSGERYAERSVALRRLSVDVDSWPAPPAGLFVVEERTVYLRSRSPMTVAHEFGHALDCALGEGIYHTTYSQRVRRLYRKAKSFVTPYASTGIDEYFAESVRAFVEINDPASFWPRATRVRLRRIDPAMCNYVEQLFRSTFIAARSSAGESTDHSLKS
ncbi:MAG: hypothetical protein JO165_03405 [Candidatus Eremiobacteraeota bacterium]|nr:hypothetical protein [Candidatus Eremiobacteraeota bacterium]